VNSRADGPVLDRRTLNRTLLARQWLSRRSDGTPADVLRHLVGLQAQSPSAPYVGVATRLNTFAHADLANTLADRSTARLVNLRGTIHWSLSQDAVDLRTWVQVGLERGLATTWGSQLAGVDLRAVATAAEDAIGAGSIGVDKLGKTLAATWPDVAPAVLASAARVVLPLVQVPPRAVWGRSGSTTYAHARSWLPMQAPGTDPRLVAPSLVRRYLRAFGPASVRDVQAWSGLTRLREVVEDLEPDLRHYRDESGTDLVDLAELGLADGAEPLPPLFVAPFDNVILSHADRRRIISDESRRAIATKNGLIPGTVLIDGFVAATWQVDATSKEVALVTVRPFRRLAKRTVSSLTRPGQRIGGIVVDTALTCRVTVEQPD